MDKNVAAVEKILLQMQIEMLKKLAEDYQGKTIDNIIQQMEARLDELIKQETILNNENITRKDVPQRYYRK